MIIDARTAYTQAYRTVRIKSHEYWRIPRYETYYFAAAERSYRGKIQDLQDGVLLQTCQTEHEYWQDRRDESKALVWSLCAHCPRNGKFNCIPHCPVLDLADDLLPRIFRQLPRPYGTRSYIPQIGASTHETDQS